MGLDFLQVLSLSDNQLNETIMTQEIWSDVADTLVELRLNVGYLLLSNSTFSNFTKLQKLQIGAISVWYVQFLPSLALTELSLNGAGYSGNQMLFSASQVAILQPGLFKDFGRLTRLTLTHSAISAIMPGAFKELNELVELYLASNRISTIMPGAFKGLSSIGTLTLSSNQLKTLEWHVFDPMDYIQYGGHPRMYFLFSSLDIYHIIVMEKLM